MSNDDFNARLSRIEAKIDTLAEAMVKITRMEERLLRHGDGMDRLTIQLGDHEQRLRTIEHTSKRNGIVIGAFERFGWAIISAGLALVAYFLQTGEK
jgi:hypothetical protein